VADAVAQKRCFSSVTTAVVAMVDESAGFIGARVRATLMRVPRTPNCPAPYVVAGIGYLAPSRTSGAP